MAKDKLFQDILDLLEEDKKTQEWLLEKIKSIMRQNGDRVFSNLLKVFTHLELEPQDAEKVWNEIISHRGNLSKTIGRPVGLRVAMLDYFISVNKQIRNPKKFFAIDTGVVNSLAFKFSDNIGRLLENLIFLELKRLGLELFYYKTANDYEVDFVARDDLLASLIQVSWDVSDEKTLNREVRALIRGMKELKIKKGIILTIQSTIRYS